MAVTHKLYDIWEVEADNTYDGQWRLQLVNYVAHFRTQAEAEAYAGSVKKERGKR